MRAVGVKARGSWLRPTTKARLEAQGCALWKTTKSHTPLNVLRFPIIENRPINATILMPDLTMSALAHSALHVTLETHVNAIVTNALLAHFLDHELVHDRRPANGTVGVVWVDLQMLERSGNQTDLAIPSVIRVIDRKIKVEVLAVTPHLELVAEHDLARILRAINNRDVTEFRPLVMDVVDQRTQRRDSKAPRNKQDIVAFHVLERERLAVRPANSDDIAALHIMQVLREFAGATNAKLNEAAFGRGTRNGNRSLANTED